MRVTYKMMTERVSQIETHVNSKLSEDKYFKIKPYFCYGRHGYYLELRYKNDNTYVYQLFTGLGSKREAYERVSSLSYRLMYENKL